MGLEGCLYANKHKQKVVRILHHPDHFSFLLLVLIFLRLFLLTLLLMGGYVFALRSYCLENNHDEKTEFVNLKIGIGQDNMFIFYKHIIERNSNLPDNEAVYQWIFLSSF